MKKLTISVLLLFCIVTGSKAQAFLGTIQLFAFGFTPTGWLPCDGRLLPINQNQALFALLGTTYGGNGTTNFALPDLRGRTLMHTGNGHTQGESSGSATVTLTANNLPAHIHTAPAHTVTAGATSANGNTSNPTGNVSGVIAARGNEYSTVGNAQSGSISVNSTVGSSGSNQAIDNMQPYLVLNYCIATQGLFPSQNK